jgi:hypothetical protein
VEAQLQHGPGRWRTPGTQESPAIMAPTQAPPPPNCRLCHQRYHSQTSSSFIRMAVGTCPYQPWQASPDPNVTT